jgi:hypothetical protein
VDRAQLDAYLGDGPAHAIELVGVLREVSGRGRPLPREQIVRLDH